MMETHVAFEKVDVRIIHEKRWKQRGVLFTVESSRTAPGLLLTDFSILCARYELTDGTSQVNYSKDIDVWV